jgi:hypothetical protein
MNEVAKEMENAHEDALYSINIDRLTARQPQLQISQAVIIISDIRKGRQLNKHLSIICTKHGYADTEYDKPE